MKFTTLPGTVTPYAQLAGGAFSLLEPMISATGGLSLSQVCTITGLEGSTIQNWVKRGWVAKPILKKYFERQLARILIISALRDSMQLDRIIALLGYLNGSVEDMSDDIIRESQLYDYLCIVLHRIDLANGFSSKIVADEISGAISDFRAPDDSVKRLFSVLNIMVYACVSGTVKSETDLLYRQLEI